MYYYFLVVTWLAWARASTSTNSIAATSIATVLSPTNATLFANETRTRPPRTGDGEDSPPPPGKWIAQLFDEAKSNFAMDSSVNANCTRDFRLYETHSQNLSSWAIRMMDSSQWPAYGLLSGVVDHLGNWRECTMIEAHGITGQYCLIKANYTYTNDEQTNRTMKPPLEDQSAWSIIDMYNRDKYRLDRRKLKWALCLPSSCTNADVEHSLENVLKPIFEKNNFEIHVDVEDVQCDTRKKEYDYRSRTGFILVSGFFAVLILLSILSSLWEYSKKDEKLIKDKSPKGWSGLFRAFSVVANYKTFFKVSKKSDYPALHFCKTICMLFIINGHRFIYSHGFPQFNAQHVERIFYPYSLELSETNMVDVFFMISGFLLFKFGFEPMLKGKSFFLIFSILFRWIRLVPLLCAFTLFVIYVLPYMNDGPFWNYRVMEEVNNCKASLWPSIFAVNNIVNSDKQCMYISWYVSVDIQLSIVGGIILLIMTKNKLYGLFAVFFTFLASIVIVVVQVYRNNYPGLLMKYLSSMEDLTKSPEFSFHISTYSRMGPYLIGFAGAFLYKTLKEQKFTFSLKHKLETLLVLVIAKIFQYNGLKFYEADRSYDSLEHAIYAAVNRWLTVIPYAIFICIYFNSGFGFFNKFLECKIFVLLGRLTFCVYLINTTVMLFHAASFETVLPTGSAVNRWWWLMADIGYCYLFGFLVHLFLEAPLSHISKILQLKLLNILKKSYDTNPNENCQHKSTIEANKKNNPPETRQEPGFQNGVDNKSYVDNNDPECNVECSTTTELGDTVN